MADKKEKDAKPRRRRGQKKQPSTGRRLAAAGGGAVVGGGAVIALQHFTDVDNRIISGIATGLGAAATVAGLVTGSPYLAEAGAGVALPSAVLFAKDLIQGDGGLTADQRQAGAGDQKQLVTAIRAELAAGKPAEEAQKPRLVAGVSG